MWCQTLATEVLTWSVNTDQFPDQIIDLLSGGNITSADFCQTLILCLNPHLENPIHTSYHFWLDTGYLLFHCTCNHYFSINWSGIELYKLPPDLFNIQTLTISVRYWLDWFQADSKFPLCIHIFIESVRWRLGFGHTYREKFLGL